LVISRFLRAEAPARQSSAWIWPVGPVEADRLNSSGTVDDTAVYNLDGEQLGSVHHLMIDKVSGHVDRTPSKRDLTL
jgi:hypothetical protein